MNSHIRVMATLVLLAVVRAASESCATVDDCPVAEPCYQLQGCVDGQCAYAAFGNGVMCLGNRVCYDHICMPAEGECTGNEDCVSPNNGECQVNPICYTDICLFDTRTDGMQCSVGTCYDNECWRMCQVKADCPAPQNECETAVTCNTNHLCVYSPVQNGAECSTGVCFDQQCLGCAVAGNCAPPTECQTTAVCRDHACAYAPKADDTACSLGACVSGECGPIHTGKCVCNDCQTLVVNGETCHCANKADGTTCPTGVCASGVCAEASQDCVCGSCGTSVQNGGSCYCVPLADGTACPIGACVSGVCSEVSIDCVCNECEVSVSTGISCYCAALPDRTPCSTGLCHDHTCVECVFGTDCQPLGDMLCWPSSVRCDANECNVTHVHPHPYAVGTPCFYGESGNIPGKCRNGTCVGCVANLDCPMPASDCLLWHGCVNDSCSISHVADGTECTGGVCYSGVCELSTDMCDTPANCTAAQECVTTPLCLNRRCVYRPIAIATPCLHGEAQAAGNCYNGTCTLCNGADPQTGECSGCAVKIVGSDGCSCSVLQNGTSCSFDVGMCTGGECIECATDADCAQHQCAPPVECVDHACVVSADPPAIAENGTCTTGRCHAELCVECIVDGDCTQQECQAPVACITYGCSATSGLPADGTACSTGVCHTGQCVACIVDADCAQPECHVPIVCMSNVCVSSASPPLIGEGETCTAGLCHEGQCVGCITASDCADRNCTTTCASGVCDYQCGVDCVRGVAWWSKHTAWAVTHNPPLLPVTVGGVPVSTAAAVRAVLIKSWGPNMLDRLAGTLLAAKLNGKAGAALSTVSADMAMADALLIACPAGSPQTWLDVLKHTVSCVGQPPMQIDRLAYVIERFNLGHGAVSLCSDIGAGH